MNPNAKDYAIQILSKSGKIKLPLADNHAELLESFLDSIDGCAWEKPTTKIDKRQFETSLKGWYKEFKKELVKFHRENPPTFRQVPSTLKTIGLHTMDDQGFEGQVMSDNTFYRWIKDFEDEK